MQMFKKPIQKAYQGDRVGMLIKNLDHTTIERSLACNEGYVQSLSSGIFLLKKIIYYKNEIKSNSKFYLIIGNQGVNAKCLFFSKEGDKSGLYTDFDIKNVQKTVVNLKQLYSTEFTYQDELVNNNEDYTLAILKFDNNLLMPPDMIALGSKIDFDVSHKSNRIAFYGKMIDKFTEDKKLKIYKMKSKSGQILRLVDENVAIVKSLFKKDSNIDDFIGKTVCIAESENKIFGKIVSKFGQAGKVKVEFNENIKDLKLKNNDCGEIDYNSFTITLEYKKYIKY